MLVWDYFKFLDVMEFLCHLYKLLKGTAGTSRYMSHDIKLT